MGLGRQGQEARWNTSSIAVGSAPEVRMKMVGVRGFVSGRMLSMVQG